MRYKKIFISSVIISIIFYIIIFFQVEKFITRQFNLQIQKHSKVISNALWSFNKESAFEYLDLAVNTGHYKSLTVYDSDNKQFLHIKNSNSSIVSGFFYQWHIYPLKTKTEIILYENTPIGKLEVCYYHKSILIHIYIFVIFLLLFIIYAFFLNTLKAKKNLEMKVQERTIELSEAMIKAMKNEEKFKAFADQTALGIISMRDNKIIYCNKAAAKIFETSAKAVNQWSKDDFMQKLSSSHNKDFLNISTQPTIINITTIQDNKRWVEIIAKKIKYHNQEDLLISLNDITDKKAMEEQLHQRKKLDSIGQLAGGIAHDFNNMLTGIIGSAELLNRKTDPDSSSAKLINLILETSARASELTSKLLTFSRKSSFTKVNYNLHQAIQDAILLLERTIDKGIIISADLKALNPFIKADSSQIQSSLLNIAVNARDSIQDKGSIIISSDNIYLDKQFCLNSRFNIKEGEYIKITIQDSGHGIPKQIQQKIFEPFFTTKETGKGTGLGLSVVYGSIIEHNGAIEIKSKTGKGTSISLYLPVVNHTAEIKVIENVHETKFNDSGSILLIDDEMTIRETLKAMLEDLGFSVYTAENGLEGLNEFKSRQPFLKLIILDMIMPKMSGENCFREIRKIDPQIPIMLCSGYTNNVSVKHLIDSDKSLFLKKPFRFSEIAKAIEKLIEN